MAWRPCVSGARFCVLPYVIILSWVISVIGPPKAGPQFPLKNHLHNRRPMKSWPKRAACSASTGGLSGLTAAAKREGGLARGLGSISSSWKLDPGLSPAAGCHVRKGHRSIVSCSSGRNGKGQQSSESGGRPTRPIRCAGREPGMPCMKLNGLLGWSRGAVPSPRGRFSKSGVSRDGASMNSCRSSSAGMRGSRPGSGEGG